MIAEAERSGSLDSAIRCETPNDLGALIANLPVLEAIAFNGGRASRTGRAGLGDAVARLALIDLPSSSPAYAGMPLADKLARWNRIAEFAADRPTPSPWSPS